MQERKKPGRVYAVKPDRDKGERSGFGHAVFTHTGAKIPFASRVEFDQDADEGMASVTAYIPSEDGQPLLDYSANKACEVTFRTWCRVCPTDKPPAKTPNAKLWNNSDGIYIANGDPLPTVEFTEPEPAPAVA